MASLESVLASIPGYGGFVAKRQMNERSDALEVEKENRMVQIAQAVQQQRRASQVEQKAAAMQAEIDALPVKSRETVAPILMKYGLIKDAVPLMEPKKGQPIGSGGLLNPDGSITAPAARPAPPAEVKPPPVRQRYDGTNVIQEEFRDGQWMPIGSGPRFAPPAPEKPPKLATPKVGYRWNAEGTEQEPIPGGPVDVKLKADKAQAKKGVGLALQSMSSLQESIADLKADPGLPRITGSVFGRTPNITNEATGAQAKLDSIKSKVFVAALQAMREASKTGGAVGQVTEKEGDKLERTLAALDQAQGTADFQRQLDRATQELNVSMALIRNAYKEQYGEDVELPTAPSPTPPAQPQPASGAFSDPAKEQRYQAWKRRQGK